MSKSGDILKHVKVEPWDLRANVAMNHPLLASLGVMCLGWWENRENQKFFFHANDMQNCMSFAPLPASQTLH